MSKSSKPPALGSCEAELITTRIRVGVPADAVALGNGGQCGQPAVGTRAGHPVCWLHMGAIRQLTFVKRPADSHLTR